jgi:hypothetical protein
MADPNIGELTASVYERRFPGKPTDNIFTSNALFFALGDKGFKEQADGGRLIEADIEYAQNSTNAMIGEFDTIDTTRIDVFDAARFDWKICAGTCTYSYLEMLRADGSEAKFDIIAAKIESERNSHISKLNTQAWNSGTPSANELTSIPTLIPTDPTIGTVGGINRATFSFWRSRQTSGAKSSTAFDNLQAAMRSIHNQCSLGGFKKRPTHVVTSRTVMEGFEGTLTTLNRYLREDRKGTGDPAFMNDALEYKGLPMFYDEDASPSDSLYFLNNEMVKFVYLKGAWVKLDPLVTPTNQLVNVHKMYTMGNFALKAGRHCGVVTAIT